LLQFFRHSHRSQHCIVMCAGLLSTSRSSSYYYSVISKVLQQFVTARGVKFAIQSADESKHEGVRRTALNRRKTNQQPFGIYVLLLLLHMYILTVLKELLQSVYKVKSERLQPCVFVGSVNTYYLD